MVSFTYHRATTGRGVVQNLVACAIGLAMLRVLMAPPNLKLAEGQCWSGRNSTLSLNRLDNLQTTYLLEEILEGPGLTDTNDDRAACRFVVKEDHTPHFPHAMQQLYRCFSWWRANPRKEPYLVLFKQPLNEYLTGMVERFRDVFGVKVVHFRRDLKVVRGAVNYDDYENEKHSFAMRSKADAHALRDGILKYYRIPRNASCSEEGIVRIGILDRKKTRSFQNRGAMVKAIEEASKNGKEQHKVKFRVTDFDVRSFQEQVEFLANVDILISAHGAQLTGLPFLPNCAHVLELFPAGYHLPYFYGSLAAVSGVQHSFMYLGTNLRRESNVATNDPDSRQAAVSASLCPQVDALAKAVVQLIAEWKKCCRGSQHRASTTRL